VDPDPNLIISESIAVIHYHPLTTGAVIGMIVLLLLLLASALMSGSEIALFSLSPAELKRVNEQKGGKNPVVHKLLGMPETLLATILIANNFVNISFVILSTFVTNSLVDFSFSPLIGFVFQVIIITFLILLFGEILPKLYASHHALTFAYLMAQPLFFLCKLFRPLSYLLTRSSYVFSNRIPNRPKNISMHDLSHALELTTSSIHEERNILEGIVKFSNIDVRDIMKPRMDVVTAHISWSFSKLIALIIESGYSRIPVYSESPDNIKGILYVKDLLPHLNKNDAFKWQSLIRPPYFVPETKKISDLLHDFQTSKIHVAIVIDEYGGTCGLVTLEDILEEIIGEIIDESDSAEKAAFTKIDEYHYLFDGKISLHDFCKTTGLDEHLFDEIRGEADTLAGLILELTGDIPEKGKTTDYHAIMFTIEAVAKRRITQIRVKLPKTHS
jgi:putative hemolysin